jgi:hypothetical protein
MNKEFYINGTGLGVGNNFKAQVIERRPGHPDEGKVVAEMPRQSNLILSHGMDALASGLVCDLFTFCAVGVSGVSGVTPTRDTSGSVTAMTSGLICTASSSSFGPSGAGWSSHDVGKLIAFSNGQYAIINSVSGPSGCTLSKALGITSPLTFNDYYISETALDSEVQRTNTYLTGVGNCGSTFNGASGIYTHTRTFQFPIDTGHYYTDVGFSGASGAGANLNARGLLGIEVLAGQQLQVVYNFLLTVTPTTPRYKVAGIVGWNGPSGYEQLASDQFSIVSLLGQTSYPATGVLIGEPYAPKNMGMSTENTAIPAYNSSPPAIPSSVAGGNVSLSSSSYVPGSNVIYWTGTFGTNAGTSSSIYKLFTTDAVGQLESGLIFLFTSPQTKSALYTLTVTWQYAWGWLF